MSAVPLNAPVTFKVSGTPSLGYGLDWDPTSALRSEAINRLSQAGTPAESIVVQLTLGILGVERAFTATIVVRASASFSTTESLSAAVNKAMTAASGNPVTVALQSVGAADAKVNPDSGAGSWFDRFLAWLEEFGGTLGTAVKWLAVLLAIGLVVWLLVETGVWTQARAAFA
jgi:hypothetical protein